MIVRRFINVFCACAIARIAACWARSGRMYQSVIARAQAAGKPNSKPFHSGSPHL